MSRTLTAADRSRLIRLASSLPKGSDERRAILAGLKSAYSKPETTSTFRLSGAQIEKDVRAAGQHTSEHIDKYDFKKLLWNPVEVSDNGRHGRMSIQWFAYPHGDFMNKSSGNKGNYIYGYVEVDLKPTRDIGGDLVVETINFIKSW